jgi:hypothetical protein
MPLPNWDENLPSTSRFTILPAFNNEAVRDNNTGLVWERAPNLNNLTWAEATLRCLQKQVGGTTGWRLPSIVELDSVRDPTLPSPYVPLTVFAAGVNDDFWSATTIADNPSRAWFLSFQLGLHGGSDKLGAVTLSAWAVRGPMNADKY